jgi:crotonobetainyl-CoA:carnitine CoA-transferase CaiB-like acyl-CoA transferase
VARPPARYSDSTTVCHETVPARGAATSAILAELGYSEAETDILKQAGCFG